MNREEFLNFIKTNKDIEGQLTPQTYRYMYFFDQNQSTGKAFNVSGPGFFFNCCWMFYRKMYVPALLWILILALNVELLIKPYMHPDILNVTSIPLITGIVLYLLQFFSLLFYGDYMYLQYAKMKIARGVKTRGVINKWLAFFYGIVATFGVGFIFGFLMLTGKAVFNLS